MGGSLNGEVKVRPFTMRWSGPAGELEEQPITLGRARVAGACVDLLEADEGCVFETSESERILVIEASGSPVQPGEIGDAFAVHLGANAHHGGVVGGKPAHALLDAAVEAQSQLVEEGEPRVGLFAGIGGFDEPAG